MPDGLTQTVAPTVEPVSLDTLKEHLRIDGDYEDGVLDIYRKAARLAAENYQRRQLITATWQWTLDEFPTVEFVVPRPPLQSVSSITYLDSAGDSQTWAAANYQVDTTSLFGRVKPVSTANFPSTASDTYKSVTVTFVAGYGAAATSVPETTRNGVLLLAAHLYENREPIVIGQTITELPKTVEYLLDAERAPKLY